MKFIRFIRDILTEGSASGASSKRVAGMLGWLIALGVAIYCSISKTQAPEIIEVIVWVSASLLGLDNITAIWKSKKAQTDAQKEEA